MSAELWQRALQILRRVEDLEAEERDHVLAGECADDAELRDRVLELLAKLEAPEDENEELDQGMTRPGEFLGPYQVLKHLGTGGMGEVYLAIRTDDTELRVDAVKVLLVGQMTMERLARAVREGKTLQKLQGGEKYFPEYRAHGRLPDGRPYVAMEFIDGVPIDQYCRDHQLALSERLQLFLKVCEAVSFAHHDLVLHRDLKPANLLVTSDGAPKLLDFGIAKQLSSDRLAAKTLTAGFERPHYSPNYASPEQVEGARLRVTSDVYSLGVILYLLLSGRVSAAT